MDLNSQNQQKQKRRSLTESVSFYIDDSDKKPFVNNKQNYSLSNIT